MKALNKRLLALEGSKPEWDKTHLVLWQEFSGQREEEAVAAYGEKIGPNDLTIMVRFVSPKHRADGSVIPQTTRRREIRDAA